MILFVNNNLGILFLEGGAFGYICVGEDWKEIEYARICIGEVWKDVSVVNICISESWKVSSA